MKIRVSALIATALIAGLTGAGAAIFSAITAAASPFGGSDSATCGPGLDCAAATFTATEASSGPAVAVAAQLTCAVDFGPGVADCVGTDGSGYIQFSPSAVVDIGSTRLQSSQVLITGGYLTLDASAIRRLAGDPVPIEGGVRHVAVALGTCASGVEWAVRADIASGVSTGSRSRLCLCTSDGAGSPAYAWQNLVTGNVGTSATCPN